MQAGLRKEEWLYQQNQGLGYQINYLNDQNNFYRISINNIKKLNFNINKRLAHTPVNSRMPALDPKNIAESYAAITNQIQLKNLQLKVGNMKRKVVRVQKIHEGSLSSLVKQSQQLQNEINLFARELEYYTIQNDLLDNIYFDDYVISKAMCEEKAISRSSSVKSTWLRGQGKSKNLKIKDSCKEPLVILEQQQLKQLNKLQKILKEQKQIKQQKNALNQKLKALKEERLKLAQKVYDKSFNIRVAYADEINRLKNYNKREEQLLKQIKKQDSLLEEQYKTNQQHKQKIVDRNEVQMKDIKSLQDKIKKRNQELKQLKTKLENLQLNRANSTITLK